MLVLKAMRLTLIRYLSPLILGLCIGAILVAVLAMLRGATPPLESAGAVSWPDYWLNRYQTLIAGIAALVVAGITIRVMRRQIETARADEADRALTRYAIAILDVMQKYEEATPASGDETLEDAQKRLSALRDATDEPTMKAAMMDTVLGLDQPVIAMFVNNCRFSAVARVHDRADQMRHTNMVWPLYIALTNGITRRKALLRDGARVSELYTLSTIDQDECRRTFVEGRPPLFR